MSTIKVESFNYLEGPHAEAFLRLPQAVEELSEASAKAERAGTEALLNSKNTYYTHGAVKNFVAYRDGKAVGRVSAFDNSLLPSSPRYGLVGLFCSINDNEVAVELINSAATCFSERGITMMRGPMAADIWHRWRFMIKGFEEKPFPGEPRQPEYYPQLFLAAGFNPVRISSTKEVTNLKEMLKQLKKADEFNQKRGIAFRTFDHAKLDTELPILYQLCRHSFANNWGVTDTTEEEFRDIYTRWLGRVGSEQIVFAIDSNDNNRVVGLGFAVGQKDTMNIRTIAVLPAHCGFGVGQAVSAELYRRAIASGMKKVHHCTMGPNSPTQRWDKGVGIVTRQYAMYERAI